MDNLSAAGLNETEAKVYKSLLAKREWLPSELAKTVNETRTNIYKILDNLVDVGLAERLETGKKLRYKACSPTRLLELAAAIRRQHQQAESVLEQSASELLREYVKVTEQPGVQFYQGASELKNIFMDQLQSGEEIYIVRPDYDLDLYDFDFMSEIRHMARRANIKRYAITPDKEKAPVNYQESDPFMLLERTWMRAADYTAPVEWNVYGDKLAMMSYGNEAMGMIIESPQIAEAFRQLYRLLETGLRRAPGYEHLPEKAKYVGSTAEQNHHEKPSTGS